MLFRPVLVAVANPHRIKASHRRWRRAASRVWLPGQYYDAESNTNYNLFRTFDPPSGRYLQADPAGQAAGPSLYAYVGNDPLSHRDMLGLQETEAPGEETPEQAWEANPGLGPNQGLLPPESQTEKELNETGGRNRGPKQAKQGSESTF